MTSQNLVKKRSSITLPPPSPTHQNCFIKAIKPSVTLNPADDSEKNPDYEWFDSLHIELDKWTVKTDWFLNDTETHSAKEHVAHVLKPKGKTFKKKKTNKN